MPRDKEIGESKSDIFKTVHERYRQEDREGKFIDSMDRAKMGTGTISDWQDHKDIHNDRLNDSLKEP